MSDSSPTARGLSWFLRLIGKACLGALLGLLVGEGALRVAGLPTGSSRSFRSAYDLDDLAPGPYRPGDLVHIAFPPPIAYTAHFNSFGCRGAEPRQSERPPILCVGDSLTFGYGLEDEHAWPAQLDRLLAEAGGPQPVLNLSVGALLIDDELRYLEEALPRLRPRVVILMVPSGGYGAAENVSGLSPHQRSRRREERARVWYRRLWHETALYEAQNYSLLWREMISLQGSGMYPRDFEAGDDKKEVAERVALRERYAEKVDAFRDRVEDSGAEFLLVTYPKPRVREGRVSFEAGWTQTLPEQLGCAGADPLPLLLAAPDPNGLVLYPYDMHLSKRGAELIARSVQDALRREGWL